MLEVKNLSFGYHKGTNVQTDLSLEFKEGGVYGLLGKNGTGKSTLLYLMMGLLRPSQGEVLMDGKNPLQRLPETMEQMFIVPEEYDLPNTTLSKYVDALRPFYPTLDESLLRQCLEVFEMPGDLKMKGLSMGQKKKVYISLALSLKTKVLLMDEPTNGLDIPAKSQFRKALALGMTDDRIIIISTHQVKDVEALVDHVTIINNNQVLMNEALDPEQPTNLEELFLQTLTKAGI